MKQMSTKTHPHLAPLNLPFVAFAFIPPPLRLQVVQDLREHQRRLLSLLVRCIDIVSLLLLLLLRLLLLLLLWMLLLLLLASKVHAALLLMLHADRMQFVRLGALLILALLLLLLLLHRQRGWRSPR
jgi:hypothetical protein